MAQVSLRGIRKEYNEKVAVAGIDLDIEAGEFIVLVGPSGCGKSTLLRLIAGLEEISSGTLIIDGKTCNDVQPQNRDIAMVFQSYALFPHLTVAQNIGYGLKVRGSNTAEQIATAVRETAGLLGLEELLERRPEQLSGGQRQRVAMSRAMIRDPSLFLFDEPLSNLDAQLRTSLRVEIKRIHRRLGKTTIYVTHDQIEAMTLADRIVVLSDGQVEQIGDSLSIYDKPANLFVGKFIGTPQLNCFPIRFHDNKLMLADGSDAQILVADAANNITPLVDLLRHNSTRVPEQIMLGIRPEAVIVDAAAGLTLDLDLIEHTGPETHLHLVGNEIKLCAVSKQRIPAATAKFVVAFAGVGLHLFGDDDKRLELNFN